MKKYISILLVALMLFAFLATIASAESKIEFVVSEGSAMPGENVSLYISFKNNPGVATFNGSVTFDQNNLELLSIEGLIGSGLWSLDEAADDHCFSWADTANFASDANVMKLNFKVKETAAPSTYEVGVYFDPDWDGVANYAEETIDVIITAGSVTVTAPACQHTNKKLIEEKTSTCKEQGWDAYYKCPDCERLFNLVDEEIDSIPFRPIGTVHTGGTATCSSLAVCSVCEQPYGSYGSHSFTATTQNEKTLKSAGTCIHLPVYYYSCKFCGELSSETFEAGEYDATNHIGETYLQGEKEATCCEDGYTGDTYCSDCEKKISYGKTISATKEHVDADGKWESDGTKHWHTCYYGTKFDETAHSGGTATCKDQAICSACGRPYGSYGSHSYTAKTQNEKTLKSEGTCTQLPVYYYSCADCGVCETNDVHTFTAGSLESHNFTATISDSKYLKSAANCVSPAIYYYSCTACGTKSESTFTFAEKDPANHVGYIASVTKPTCTEKGYTTHTCACGDSYMDTQTDALGHNFRNGICTRCEEKDPDYTPEEQMNFIERIINTITQLIRNVFSSIARLFGK